MEQEMPKFVRLIQATVFTKRQVNELTANVHLSEALRKESDRSGFRATPRAKNEAANTSTPDVDASNVRTSRQGTGRKGHNRQSDTDEDAESIGPLSSDHDID